MQELCRSVPTSAPDGTDGEWTIGSLNGAEYTASPHSLLTASVDYTEHGQGGTPPELKIYYNEGGKSDMRCAFVTLGQQAWVRRRINNKF